MKIEQTKTFVRLVKKLHDNQKTDLHAAIQHIVQNPADGDMKRGDLAGVRVYKFTMVNQLTLLAYLHEPDRIVLLMVGTHENFYRDLKR
jgi:mRNA interferase RelE/StbE